MVILLFLTFGYCVLAALYYGNELCIFYEMALDLWLLVSYAVTVAPSSSNFTIDSHLPVFVVVLFGLRTCWGESLHIPSSFVLTQEIPFSLQDCTS